MANTRLIIINDNKDQILFSKSLRDQISKQQQKRNVNKTEVSKRTNDTISASSGTQSSPSSSENPPIYPESPLMRTLPYSQPNQYNTFGSDFQSSQQSPSYPTPNLNSGFDSNFLLLELRNEYERKLQHYQMLWRKNLEEMDRLNKDLFKKNKELFSNEVKRIDDTVLKKHFDIVTTSTKSGVREQPCKNIEEKLIRCFKVNEKKSLLCSDLVREFSQCIDQARIQMLMKQK